MHGIREKATAVAIMMAVTFAVVIEFHVPKTRRELKQGFIHSFVNCKN